MLHIALMNERAGSSTKERRARRSSYHYPAGLRVVNEYWLMTTAPRAMIVLESEGIAPIREMVAAWDDLFDITVVPALTAEEGLASLREHVELARR